MLEFEKLKVYQKALGLVDQVYRAIETFPRQETYGLASQFSRAATSIVLNIAEGAGRETGADRKRFYSYAMGSVFECIALMEISRRRGYSAEEALRELRDTCEEIGRMIHGLRSSLDHLR